MELRLKIVPGRRPARTSPRRDEDVTPTHWGVDLNPVQFVDDDDEIEFTVDKDAWAEAMYFVAAAGISATE